MASSRFLCFYGLLAGLIASPASSSEPVDSKGPIDWVKHEIVQRGHCNTAIALDANEDGLQDVVCSYGDRVVLHLAPTWTREVVLHRFASGRKPCIHSAVLDVDQDGDLDWAGAVAAEHPFWLENPGTDEALAGAWTARPIDSTITGIHCLLAADIDRDGKDDLLVNNFLPEKGLKDSIAWLKVPAKPHLAEGWIRNVFANGDARGGSHYMGVGDVDGDGFPEIAVGAKGAPFEDGNWFAFWKHPGAGSSDKPWQKQMLAIDQVGATNVAGVDLNGDGRVDWAATRGHGRGVLWFENPTWKMRVIDPDLASPHSLAVGDFDDDGDMDLASCGFLSERVMWYQNDGRGQFDLHVIDTQQESYDLRSVDMDGDGDLDLLNAGRATQNVVWYENR